MTITTTFVTVLRRFEYLAEKVMYSNYYSTKLVASPPRGPVTKLGQLTREERYPLALLEPFSLLFSTTGVDQGDL
jgi:hypothetical protein